MAFVVLDISPHLSFSLRTSRTWLIQLKSLNQMVRKAQQLLRTKSTQDLEKCVCVRINKEALPRYC